MIRAAMLSKPIIITSTSSTRNYIENKFNGILVEMGNEISLANEISLLISDSQLRERMCNRMREEIKKFSLENYVIKLKNIILQINQK
jgi:glycosyltransferase involved in cell wall biosynthesis